MDTSTLVQVAKRDQTRLTQAATRIKRANAKFADAFSAWVMIVGAELEAANKIHANRKTGTWGVWCSTELGMTKSHANRMLKAYRVMQALMSAPASADILPASERQCRALAPVGIENAPKAWSLILSAQQQDPEFVVTESSIKETLRADKKLGAFFSKPSKAKASKDLKTLTEIFERLQSESPEDLAAWLAKVSKVAV